MAKYVYRPRDNRTPVQHPIFGGLEWGTVVDNPAAANDPDFQEVKPAKKQEAASASKPAAKPAQEPGSAGRSS